MLKKNWMVFLGLILLGGALAVGGFVIGQSTRSADYARALAKYDQLKSNTDLYLGSALKSLGSALAEQQRLSKLGGDIESEARSVAALSLGIHDCIASLRRAQEAGGSSSPANDTGGIKQ